MNNSIKYLLVIYLAFIGIDLFTHNIWQLFPLTEIDWFGQKWRICDIAFSIGKSFTFLIGYILLWRFWVFAWKITELEMAWIGKLISFNMIAFAGNDLFKECTGGNFKQYYTEWIAVGITTIITLFNIYKRFR